MVTFDLGFETGKGDRNKVIRKKNKEIMKCMEGNKVHGGIYPENKEIDRKYRMLLFHTPLPSHHG